MKEIWDGKWRLGLSTTGASPAWEDFRAPKTHPRVNKVIGTWSDYVQKKAKLCLIPQASLVIAELLYINIVVVNVSVPFWFFETQTHIVQSGLGLTVYLRLALDS